MYDVNGNNFSINVIHFSFHLLIMSFINLIKGDYVF